MSESGPIDDAALERLREWGGPSLMVQMLRLFIDSSEQRMGEIEEGFSAGDLTVVERGAHSLKSSAGNVGAVVVNDLAARIEEAALAGDDAGARALFEDLRTARESACERLRVVQGGLEA